MSTSSTDEILNSRGESDNYKAVISLDQQQNETLWFVGYICNENPDDFYYGKDCRARLADTTTSSNRRIFEEASQWFCFQEMLSVLQSLCTEEDQITRQHWCDLILRQNLPHEPHRIAFFPNLTNIMKQHATPSYLYRWELVPPIDLRSSNDSASSTTTTNRSTNHPLFDQWIIYQNHSVQKLYSTSPFPIVTDVPFYYSSTTMTNSYSSIPMELLGQGLHRTLSYTHTCFQDVLASTYDGYADRIILFQLLPQETYVETLPTNCRILESNITNKEAFDCQIHTYLHQPMDVEQPSFASSPSIIAYSLRIVPNTNAPILTSSNSSNNKTPSTLLPLLTIQWETTIHFRYPPTAAFHRRAQVIIDPPFPLVSSFTTNATVTTSTTTMSIVTYIPAGSDNDLFFVSIITHLTVFLGCTYMLRSILQQYSLERFPKHIEEKKSL